MSRAFLPWIARLGALAGVAVAVTAAAAEAPILHPPATIVMFVAGWCAPCHAEIARLDEIAVAARPFAVGVIVLDDSAAGRAMAARVPLDRLLRFPPARRAQVEASVFRDSAGLPYSIAVGADGRVCGDRRDGLDAAKVRVMVAACQAKREAAP